MACREKQWTRDKQLCLGDLDAAAGRGQEEDRRKRGCRSGEDRTQMDHGQEEGKSGRAKSNSAPARAKRRRAAGQPGSRAAVRAGFGGWTWEFGAIGTEGLRGVGERRSGEEQMSGEREICGGLVGGYGLLVPGVGRWWSD